MSAGMMTMRMADAADLKWIGDTTQSAYAVYLPVLGYPPVPVTEDYGPRIERGEVWIGELDGVLAGLLVCETYADHLMIFSIAVLPSMQGKGCGQAFLHWVEGRALELKFPEIRLYTNAKMERNIRIYERFGFQETGRRQNPKRPEFTIVDMKKRLAA